MATLSFSEVGNSMINFYKFSHQSTLLLNLRQVDVLFYTNYPTVTSYSVNILQYELHQKPHNAIKPGVHDKNMQVF